MKFLLLWKKIKMLDLFNMSAMMCQKITSMFMIIWQLFINHCIINNRPKIPSVPLRSEISRVLKDQTLFSCMCLVFIFFDVNFVYIMVPLQLQNIYLTKYAWKNNNHFNQKNFRVDVLLFLRSYSYNIGVPFNLLTYFSDGKWCDRNVAPMKLTKDGSA